MADIVTCPNCGKRNRVPATARGVPRCATCHTALPWLTAAGDGDFEEVAGNSTLPVLVDRLALALLEGEFHEGDTVAVDAADGELVLTRGGVTVRAA